ncbi:MAG: AAA family ATPase [bacterium]|nr:AAA family ATPase [bacterium]
MRFTQIRLKNWRNFVDVDVEVANRVFLVGANATGKSNFLDAIRFLRDIVITGGGFQAAIQRRGGMSKIRSLFARDASDVELDVTVEIDDSKWRYRLVFNKMSKKSSPIILEEQVWYGDNLLLSRPDENDKQDEERLSQTYLEQTFANQLFRPIADFFKTIHYSHVVPQLIRESDRYLGKRNDPFGSDFLAQLAETSERTRTARLKRIESALKIAVANFSQLEFHQDKSGIPHLRAKYQHWREYGAWQNEEDFSDGTLRLIGLLWALQDDETPLILEEPELSLHYGIVQYIPQMILAIFRERKKAIRQVFISTHSYELLSDEGIGADEVLLLQSSGEKTIIIVGKDDDSIIHELGAGLTMAEIALPRTTVNGLNKLLDKTHA